MPTPLPTTSKQLLAELIASFERKTPKRAKKATRQCSEQVAMNSTQSGLISLPGELRNKIYDTLRVRVWLSDAFSHLTEESDVTWPELFNLSRVCRQLHKETALLPFKLNAFHICYDNDFDKFLAYTSAEKRDLIGTVIFGFKDEDEELMFLEDYSTSTRLHECKGLDTIIIRLMHDSNHKETVKAYAKERSLKLIDESEYWEEYRERLDLEMESEMTDEDPEEDPCFEDPCDEDITEDEY